MLQLPLFHKCYYFLTNVVEIQIKVTPIKTPLNFIQDTFFYW